MLEEGPLEVKLSEELTDCLRRLKSEGNMTAEVTVAVMLGGVQRPWYLAFLSQYGTGNSLNGRVSIP